MKQVNVKKLILPNAERAASALNRRLLQRNIPGMGETAVTGYDFGQWASAAKRLLEHGHSFVFAQPNETDGYDVINEADTKEYIPIGMELEILKILFAPLSLILSLFVWLCAGLLSCSGFVFKLASGLLSLLAFAVLITYSVKNGIILLVLAFLISPMGLPMLAVQGLGKLQDVNSAMKNFIHS